MEHIGLTECLSVGQRARKPQCESVKLLSLDIKSIKRVGDILLFFNSTNQFKARLGGRFGVKGRGILDIVIFSIPGRPERFRTRGGREHRPMQW